MLKIFFMALYHSLVSPRNPADELEEERQKSVDKALAHEQLALYNAKMSEYYKSSADLIAQKQANKI